MLTRRGALGLIGWITSWFVAAPKIAAAFVPEPLKVPDDWVGVPDWCPKGWVPIRGQKITKEQFPYLFTVRGQSGREGFYPVYWGKDSVELENIWPCVPSILQACGWQDTLTHSPKATPDVRVEVLLLSTEPMKRSNGKECAAGHSLRIQVPRKDFESYYGAIPIEENMVLIAGSSTWFSGYRTLTIGQRNQSE